jgi:hypothetical protein
VLIKLEEVSYFTCEPHNTQDRDNIFSEIIGGPRENRTRRRCLARASRPLGTWEPIHVLSLSDFTDTPEQEKADVP